MRIIKNSDITNELSRKIYKYIFIPMLLLAVSCTSVVRFSSKKNTHPKKTETTHKKPEKKKYGTKGIGTIVSPDSVVIDKSLGIQRQKILKTAASWLGTPYLYGGETRDSVDCSAFVMNVFKEVNIDLPRTSSEQNLYGRSTNLANAEPGDLIFFNDSTGLVSHVGIYVGNGVMIHASSTVGVTYQKIDSFGVDPAYCGCKKIIGEI